MGIRNGFEDAVRSAAEVGSRNIELQVTLNAQNKRLEAGLDPLGAPKP